MVHESFYHNEVSETQKAKFKIIEGLIAFCVSVDNGLEEARVQLLDPVQLGVGDRRPGLGRVQHSVTQLRLA